ncbi:MAG: hypothetical protein LBD92_04020 [Oscillospiraceae bacterium]|nr:hypothetical protein [Oscillospiraceae bacterium]
MYNAAVKTDGRYTLKIVCDPDPPHPRDNEDTLLGKMFCRHSRYVLGDDHDYKDPDTFLASLVRKTIPDKDIISCVKDGKTDAMTLKYDKSIREWVLKAYDSFFDRWYEVETYLKPLDFNDAYLPEDILDNMPTGELLKFAKRSHLILPLYLLDHSGISVSTSDFNDQWDSGQIGWIYASFNDIAYEYGDASPDSILKAREALIAEVKTYSSYLRGECYGFQLFKDGVEQDSCWGFLGSFEDAKSAIRGYIPEEAAELVDSAEYGDDEPEYDPDENDYEQGDDTFDGDVGDETEEHDDELEM